MAFGTLGHYVSKFPNFHKRLPLHLRCDWPINILKNMHTFAKIRTLVKHVHELLHYQSTKIWTQNPSQKGDIRTKLRRGIIATTLCKINSTPTRMDIVPGKMNRLQLCPREIDKNQKMSQAKGATGATVPAPVLLSQFFHVPEIWHCPGLCK